MRHDGQLRGARRHRLFWRVYVHSLFLLVVTGATALLVASLFGRPDWLAKPQRIADIIAQRTANLAPEGLEAELLLDKELLSGLDLTLYALDGTIRASTDPARPTVTKEQLDAARTATLALPGRGHAHLAPVRSGGELEGFVGMRHGPFGVPPRAVAALLSVLAVLAVSSFLIARRTAAPLEHLTRVVRRLGEGDLAARARMSARGEVGELASAFDEMAGRIERHLRSEKELLANVSHELRTPLSRIRVALELMEEGDTAEVRSGLAQMGTDLRELEQLAGDVLTSARMDLAGQGVELSHRREPVEATALVEAAAARFRTLFPSRALVVELGGELPLIEGDPVLLRRVIDNLLDNARKYSGGAEAIVLRAVASGSRLVVEVSDRGEGVPEASLPHIFTPFYRADASRSRGTGGVGLGLSLARRIVEAHGGTIVAEARDGGGTTLRFEVPVGS